jgi:hypothetical protein
LGVALVVSNPIPDKSSESPRATTELG